MRTLFWSLTSTFICASMLFCGHAFAQQSTKIAGEYIATLHAPLLPPQVANNDLFIFNVAEGGWLKGPEINGKLVGPSGDWGRVMPNGTFKLDVRASVQADDDSVIYITYTGRVQWSEEVNERYNAGEVIEAKDMYFLTSPTFETTSEKYGWLNDVVAVGKCVSLKGGEGSYVTYDIFAMR